MIIKKIVKQEEDGSYRAEFMLTQEQISFLLSFAVGLLVQQGLATIIQQDNEESKEVQGEENKEEVKFLANINPDEMFKA